MSCNILDIFFISDFVAHFDIWNNLEKIFFFIFPKFIGGTLMIMTKIVRVPPMNFGKMKKFEKNFFPQFYSRYQNGPKNPL